MSPAGDPYSWGLTDDQARRLQDTLNRNLERLDQVTAHYLVTGAGEVHQNVPATSRVDPRPWLGLAPEALPTLTTHQPVPVVPHPIENRRSPMSDATPADRRDAWLKLVAALERNLLATKLNAQAMASVQREHGHPSVSDLADPYDATAWAAQRLLDGLRSLPVPEVPVDDTLGQASILDLAEERDRMTCHADPAKPIPVTDHCGWDGCPLRGAGEAACFLMRPSTPVEAPVEDRPVCFTWMYPDIWPHAVRSIADTRVTGVWDAVTCQACLAAKASARPRRLLDKEGDLWEETPDGQWAFCPSGSEEDPARPVTESGTYYGPIRKLEVLKRLWGPLREPEGDQYHLGDRDD